MEEQKDEVKEDKLVKINVTINNDINRDFIILSTNENEDIIIEANSVKNYEFELFETEPIFISVRGLIVRFTHSGVSRNHYITIQGEYDIDSDMEVYNGYLFVDLDINKWKEKHLKSNA